MDKHIITEYIRKQKKTATEDEKYVWDLLQMWSDTRVSFEMFDYLVRSHLEDAEKELKKPIDPMWRAGDERDFKVYSQMVKWLDQQKKEGI